VALLGELALFVDMETGQLGLEVVHRMVAVGVRAGLRDIADSVETVAGLCLRRCVMWPARARRTDAFSRLQHSQQHHIESEPEPI